MLRGAVFLCALLVGCTEEPQSNTSPGTSATINSDPAPEVLRFIDADGSDAVTRESLRNLRGWILVPAGSAGAADVTGTGIDESGSEKLLALLTSCRDCHPDHSSGFLQTAHARTSAAAELKHFTSAPPPEGLIVQTRIPGFEFHLLREGETVEQVAEVQAGDELIRHGESIDVIMGSGKYGQTYLYWKKNRLYQLPISYLSYQHQWGISPGYRDGTADFARPVTTRCLDCHTTQALHLTGTVNGYHRDAMVWGLHCIRCHGDATAHVAYHREHPDAVVGEQIVSLSSLSAERLNEICAQCHSGPGELLKPAYSYQPGEPLTEYLQLEEKPSAAEGNDPHSANQLQRLKASRCFQHSQGMSCVTCHNPHRHERGQPLVFAEHCLSCHTAQPQTCPEKSELSDSLWKSNCIGCHMPQRTDPDMVTEIGDTVATPKLRDHRIAIWPEISRRIREQALSTDAAKDE